MEHAGHSSITLTFDRYGHLMRADARDRADKANIEQGDVTLQNLRKICDIFSLKGRSRGAAV
jgi:hypothetical protein